MTKFNDAYDHTKPFSDTCAQINLAATVVGNYTVPGTNEFRYRAEFSYTNTSNVWVGYNTTPVVPLSNTTTTTNNQEFRPGANGDARYVKGGDVLSFITSDVGGAQVGISLLQLPSQ